MTYILGKMALMPILEQGGYTLKHTGKFIKAVSTPFSIGLQLASSHSLQLS
jgi:hypothetical protein